jgi:cytochrome c biogenesis protein CcdA
MEEQDNLPRTPQLFRAIFGIIMIIVYVGMGILLLCNFFYWIGGSWTWIRIALGILFIVYGIWRAYRQFKGIDSNI